MHIHQSPPFTAYVILDKNGRKCGDPYRKKTEAVFAARAMSGKFAPYTVAKVRCEFIQPKA